MANDAEGGHAAVLSAKESCARSLAQADVRAKFTDLGLESIGNSPDEFAAVINSEIPKWAKIIKESGIKPD